MALSLPDARQLSDEVLEALRLRALRGCKFGFTEADLADLLGVSRETISRWWTAYAASGLGAIPGDRTGRPVGSGRTLSDEQARHIQQQIDHHSPEELGIPAAVWTCKAVRDLIRGELGIALPVRTVGDYLKRWGYTAKVPRRHAKDQVPDEVREWLKVHEARAVEDWIAGHRDRIKLCWLPTYAPELNADEYLNNDLNGSINAAGLPESDADLRSRIERFMNRLLNLARRVRNYCRRPCVQHAAGV
jgi:transposase